MSDSKNGRLFAFFVFSLIFENCSANRSAYRLLKKYKLEDRKCPVPGQVSKKVVSNFIFIISSFENLCDGDFGEYF